MESNGTAKLGGRDSSGSGSSNSITLPPSGNKGGDGGKMGTGGTDLLDRSLGVLLTVLGGPSASKTEGDSLAGVRATPTGGPQLFKMLRLLQ